MPRVRVGGGPVVSLALATAGVRAAFMVIGAILRHMRPTADPLRKPVADL